MRLALFSFTILAACGPKSTPVTTPSGPTPTASDLAGRWRSACVDPGTGQGFVLDFDNTRETWSVEYAAYGDATCTVPFLSVHIEGPYDLLDASPDVEGARRGDFHFAARSVTPHLDAAADFLAGACGGDRFATGEATDILADGCAGLGAYPVESCPTDHDIVRRDGDTLTFGARPADNDLCSSDDRPVALGIPLVRQ